MLNALLSNSTFALTVACVFVGATLLGFAVILKFKQFWRQYKETFTQSASANMGRYVHVH
ncbi:MAG: hypothetical protein U5P41_12410 [Gammaproteobacteria bacterium]|nr:hypothetical protein [Gammaproteobacteria bacterium]